MKLLNLALVKLLIFLITGILLGYFFPNRLSATAVFYLFITLGSTLTLCHFLNAYRWFELICLLLFTGYGYTSMQHRERITHDLLDTSPATTLHRFHFRVLTPLKASRSHYRYEAVVGIAEGKSLTEKVIIRIDSSHRSSVLPIPGGIYSAVGHTTPISPPSYPGAFDYGAYLSRKNICFQIDLLPQTLRLEHPPETWRSTITQGSNYLNTRIEGSGLNGFSKGLFHALILGNRTFLDDDFYNNLRDAGGAHLVALSGLHIGIFTAIIGFLLYPLRRLRHGPWIHFGLIMIILCCYIMLTGAGASVVRSGVMFGFLAYSSLIHRRASSLNTLILSAFVLLLFHPWFLFDMGFQLSYAAVTGILLTYQPALRLWRPKQSWLRKLWSLTLVSLGAQVFTAPLVVHYFGQLPGSFLLTNLFLTPLITLFLMMGYLVMAFLVVMELPLWMIHLLNEGTSLLRWTTKVLVFPEWVITNIPTPDTLQVLLLYLFLFTLIAGLHRTRFLFVSLSMILMAQSGYIISLQRLDPPQLYICQQYGNTLLLKTGPQRELLIPDEHLQNLRSDRGDRGDRGNRSNRGEVGDEDKRGNSGDSGDKRDERNKAWTLPEDLRYDTIHPLPHLIRFNETYLFIVNDIPLQKLPPLPERTTFLLTGSAPVNLDRLIARYHPPAIIADGSNYPDVVARWKATCKQKNIPFHHTGEKGYYMLGKEKL